MPNAQKVLPPQDGRVTYCRTSYEAATGAHALLCLTEWNEFKELDLRRVHELMEVPVSSTDGISMIPPMLAGQDSNITPWDAKALYIISPL